MGTLGVATFNDVRRIFNRTFNVLAHSGLLYMGLVDSFSAVFSPFFVFCSRNLSMRVL